MCTFFLQRLPGIHLKHGSDIHPLADPTKLELAHSDFQKKKKKFKNQQQQSILERYGGEEHLNAPPKELLLAQTVWK